MTEEAIVERLGAVFDDIFDEPIAVSRGLRADQVDGWDSLTHVRLLLAVERSFSIRFTAAEVGNLTMAGDLIDLIRRKTSHSGAADPAQSLPHP